MEFTYCSLSTQDSDMSRKQSEQKSCPLFSNMHTTPYTKTMFVALTWVMICD